MIRKTRCAAVCTLAVMAAATMMSMTAAAQEKSEVIAIPYEEEDAWKDVAITNDENVTTGVNIRRTADEDGEILGFLYQGNAAWIVKKGDEWTEIFSGGITGFVKNEYLVFADDEDGEGDLMALVEKYGVEGVVTMWDDVKLFAEEDPSSEVLEVLDTRDSFVLLQDNGHWLQVKYGEEEDSVAYISEDDVSPALLFDAALLKEGVVLEEDTYEEYYEDTYYEDTYYEDTYYEETYWEPTYTEPTYTEPTYTEPTYTEPTYTQTEAPQTEAPQTEAPQTEAPQTEAPQTEAPQTEAPQTDAYVEETDAVVDDSSDEEVIVGDGGYYDADTDTYYDANGNVVENTYDSQYTDETYVDTDTYYDETYVDTDTYYDETYVETEAYYEETYVETEAYYEETYVETEAYYEETEAASTGSDDTTLLAALIYCEAGNQSYEGMVAVGAVVMNRVYSSSFPNSISEVIYQSGQFTPAYSGALDSALANGVPSTCYDAAVAAISGENPVGSALYFNTGSGKGTKIGDHQFY